MKQISQSFFAQDTVTVAQELLGKIISVNGFLARIVETEAYKDDPASHAFAKTERSALMYNTFGYVYVYLVYGMYHCLNFTTENGTPGAVLIRAVQPLTKINQLKSRRPTKKINNLCSGPGKLCQALGIDKDFNGLQLGKEVKMFNDGFKVERFESSARIGIKDALHLQWRFFIPENEFVSKIKM